MAIDVLRGSFARWWIYPRCFVVDPSWMPCLMGFVFVSLSRLYRSSLLWNISTSHGVSRMYSDNATWISLTLRPIAERSILISVAMLSIFQLEFPLLLFFYCHGKICLRMLTACWNRKWMRFVVDDVEVTHVWPWTWKFLYFSHVIFYQLVCFPFFTWNVFVEFGSSFFISFISHWP